ncbi:MAG: hypothetical protein IZT59_10050 [Verrucomicrobia bacterium]|jgi:hypothetical protein|nr:hypothetical protein [Verrucomicrobiota bacterium]|tara:strand:+ start:9851 stop:10096 length:246 start_codon:yes stop_codon:yes gene_type:complete
MASLSFLVRAWQHSRQGESGLLHAPTGFGKNLAAWLGALSQTLTDLNLPDGGKPTPRSRGIPVPEGDSQADLENLTQIIKQ